MPGVLIALAALATGPAGAAAASPEAPPASHPGPAACAFDDRVVAGDLHRDHATMLLDPRWRLAATDAPADLVSVRAAGFASDHLVREPVIDDLRALREAAAAAGHALAVQSAYRSFDYQRQVHEGWVRQLGAERARAVSARPGHSEHQLGTAIDLRTADGPAPWDLPDWAATPAGAWTVANAHRFGFVLSYPRGMEAVTCYDYEPWHFRWIGRELAARVHASGVPLRAYLDRHHPPVERAE